MTRLSLWIWLTLFSFSALAKPLHISFWHSMTGGKGQLLKSLAEEFNSKPEFKDHIEVHLEFIGSYEEGLNKLRTALLGGRGPHVVQITDIGTKVMIDSNAIVPLQKFIDQDPEFPIAQILPALKRYYQLGGVFYSLPFASSNPILYYNVDWFNMAGIKKAPTTFAELEDAATKLAVPAEKKFGLTWPLNSWFFEQFIAKQGAVLIKPTNGREGSAVECDYLSPEAQEFMGLWARMVKNKVFANVGRGWDPAEQNFLAGRVGMLITSTSDIFEVSKQAQFKLGTAAIPGPQGMNSKGGTIIGGNSLWILKNKPENEQQATYQFVKFMASQEVQKKWHTNTGYFPIRADVIESLKKEGFYEKNPNAYTAIEQLKASPDLPATRGALMGMFPQAREHIMTAIEEILSGHKTVEAALRNAKTKSDFSLRRYERGNAPLK